ncbi:MAG: thiamine-phosphate kinase [Gemmatimonadota bacterium]|nr:thiamine-phosphate kinase [Gemmatimonadota bacterium]
MTGETAGVPEHPALTPLAAGPETLWISALLDGARAGRTSAAGASEVDLAEATVIEVGPGDDAAVLKIPPESRLVISSDASVEGIHFRRAWMTWETIGYRAAASALSDLAAMAAAPLGLTMSVALPPELDAGAASAIGRGVGEALATTGGEVLGGDLVASPGPVMLDITVLGHSPAPITRNGARADDELWVTGSLGGAAAAVADLQAGLEPLPEARQAFERPRPRVVEALWIADSVRPTSMIDLSDGLGRDARHLAAASGVRIDVQLERVPAHPAVEPYVDSEVGPRLLLGGGEDYELLFTAAPGTVDPHRQGFEIRFGLDLTRLGIVSEGRGLHLSHPGNTDPPDGFDHFGNVGP